MTAEFLVDAPPARATLADLHRVEGKAELVDGKIIRMGSGRLPSRVAYRITKKLDLYVEGKGLRGEVFPDGVVYAQRPPLLRGRESFQPDASYCLIPSTNNEMRFIDGAPVFTVEVRSENDYGPGAERAMALKRADYFEAGTVTIWDVDPVAKTVTVYRDGNEDQSTLYRVGDDAEAEPAVPGWRVPVSELFA